MPTERAHAPAAERRDRRGRRRAARSRSRRRACCWARSASAASSTRCATGIRMGQVPPNTARSTVLRSVLEHLTTAGIEPAYPKEDVYHARMPARGRAYDVPRRGSRCSRRSICWRDTLERERARRSRRRMIERRYRARRGPDPPGRRRPVDADPGRGRWSTSW